MLLLYAKSKNGVSQALKPILNGGRPARAWKPTQTWMTCSIGFASRG